MVIRALYTGSWFPRTKLHLKEYFVFLRDGSTALPISPATIAAARKRLAPNGVAYHGGRFDSVTAECRGFATEYWEDGLLLISADARGTDGPNGVRTFFEQAMAPALASIYSIGTPISSPAAAHGAKRPVLAVLAQASDEDIAALVREWGDTVHFIGRSPDADVHFANDHIMIVPKNGDEGFVRDLVCELLFFREFEHKLQHFLDLHRSIWESIEAMRAKRTLTPKELPEMRDRLLDFHRDLSVLRVRLDQMHTYLAARKTHIDERGLDARMRALEAYRFGKLELHSGYLKGLWSMLDDYISATVEITGLIYQENLQREINLQQFIFLLGSVATVITLGAIPGSSLSFFSPSGDLVSRGNLVAFNPVDLLMYGGAAVLATLIIFAVVRPLLSFSKRIRVSSLLGDRASSVEANLDEKDDS